METGTKKAQRREQNIVQHASLCCKSIYIVGEKTKDLHEHT